MGGFAAFAVDSIAAAIASAASVSDSKDFRDPAPLGAGLLRDFDLPEIAKQRLAGVVDREAPSKTADITEAPTATR